MAAFLLPNRLDYRTVLYGNGSTADL